MLCYLMRIFFFTIFSISKSIGSDKELLLEISSYDNGTLYLQEKNKNNDHCSKHYAMVIKNMYVEKENKKNKDNNCKQDLRNGTANNPLLQLLPFKCNGKQQCLLEYVSLPGKPILSCNGTDVEADFIRILYTCKPFDVSELDVWNFSPNTKNVQLKKKFYMLLVSDKEEHITCSLLSNNSQSKIQILHLSFHQGGESYLFLNGSGLGIEKKTLSQLIMNSVTISGDNITMEIKATSGGTVWIEIQASCHTNITCNRYTGKPEKESDTFQRICDETTVVKGQTTTKISSKSSKQVTFKSTATVSTISSQSRKEQNAVVTSSTTDFSDKSTVSTITISSTEEKSTFLTSSITVISTNKTTVTSSSTEGMTSFTTVMKYDKTTSDLSNEDMNTVNTNTSSSSEELYTVVIVCTVLAVAVLLVVVTLTVVYTRRRKHRSISSNNHSPSDPYLDNTYSNPAVAYTEVCTFKTKDELPESNVTSQPETEYSEPAPTPENHIVSQPKDTYATVNKPTKAIPEQSNDINGSTPETTSAVEVPSVLHLESEYAHLSSVRPKVPTETENIYNG